MKTAMRTILSLILVLPFAANADPIELIVNGEFEDPNISPDPKNPVHWTYVDDELVPGWSCSNPITGSDDCELWAQETFGSPKYGSDGLETGQHLELTAQSPLTLVSQAQVPGSDGTMTLSFDYWDRTGNGIISLLIDINNTSVLSHQYELADGSNEGLWWNISISDIPVLAGDIVRIQFSDASFNGSGAHIDGVSLLAYAVPEPGTLALLGLGLLGLGFRGQRRTSI